MSGKNAQRTKGNAKPSSSSRAAEFIQQGGFIGFSNLAGNTYGYVPQSKPDDNELDGDLRMLLRKMTKKDSVTRLKAIQEFMSLCKEKDNEVIKNIISFWPRIYNKLTHDFDHRIREATQQVHHQIATKAGRDLAPHLKFIITNWLMATFDVYSPAATAAKLSFDEVFPEKKKKEVLAFCKHELLGSLQNQLLKETPETLSDPKVVPVEEREAKYVRFMSSSFLALQYFIEVFSADVKKLDNDLKGLFSEKKFWKYARNSSPMIRSSFYTLVSTCFQHIPEVLNDTLNQSSPAILSNLDEQEPIVIKGFWDAVLLCLTTFKNCWDHVNSRKAVLPKLWKLLKNCGYGNINTVYPNLLPFLSNIPTQVIGDGTGFYEEFFNNFFEGLFLKQDVLTASDTNIIMKSYMECYKYLLLTHACNKELVEYLIATQLQTVLTATFCGSSKRQMWYGALFKELKGLFLSINEQALSKGLQEVQQNLWSVLKEIVIVDERFSGNEKNFYESLIDLLFCFCEENNFKAGVQDQDIEPIKTIKEKFGGALFEFVCNVLACYIHEIFKNNNLGVGKHFNDILIRTMDKDLLKFVTIQTQTTTCCESSTGTNLITDDYDICVNFFKTVCLSLCVDTTFNNNIEVLVVKLVHLLHGNKKGEFLDVTFQETCTSNATKFLILLSEVFKYQDDEFIMMWLQSSYVQTRLYSCIEKTLNDENESSVNLSWKILEFYLQVVKNNQEKLDKYVGKLLVAIKGQFSQSSVFHPLVVGCYIGLCGTSFVPSEEFFETTLCIIRASLRDNDTSYLRDALVSCFLKAMQEKSILKKLVDVLSSGIKNMVVSKAFEMSLVCHCVRIMLEAANQQSIDDLCGDKLLFHQIMFSDQEGSTLEVKKSETLARFYIELFGDLARSGSNLDRYDGKKIVNTLSQSFENKNISTKDASAIISTYTFLQEMLLEEAVLRSVKTSNTDVVRLLLDALQETNQLTDALLDHCLLLARPNEFKEMSTVTTYCVVVSYLHDVSFIRALVEKYTDVLENDFKVKKQTNLFASFLKLLTSIVSQWYTIISRDDSKVVSSDYQNVIETMMDNLLVWKDNHSDELLFTTTLVDFKSDIVLLNTHLMELLYLCTRTAATCFRSEHWDFLLCSMVSWLQTCEESMETRNSNFDVSPFFSAAFRLFCIVASLFFNLSTDEDMLPCIKTETTICLTQHNAELITEWQEFFSPTACKTLLNIYSAVVHNEHTTSESERFAVDLCASMKFVPSSVIMNFIYKDIESEKKRKASLEKFCAQSCKLLKSGKWYFKISSYQLQARIADVIEKVLCEDESKNEEEESCRKFPPSVLAAMESSRDDSLLLLSEEGVSIKSPLQNLSKGHKSGSLLTYLLSWQLLLRLFKMSKADERAKFANYFHKNCHVSDLITCLFCMLPSSMATTADNIATTADISPFILDPGYIEIQRVAFHLLTSAMECIPALIRLWFNNNTNRKDAALVDRFVSAYISPILLKKDFQKLDCSSKEFNNMVVKTRQVAREVVAIYTVDEISMELVVKLSSNHPLSPVSVDCGKRIGVSNALWRQWMLQLTTFLSFQNGTILDGLALWKKNVDKRFEGVEECMVCFSVLHGSNYSLPSIGCKTCKKKFHPSCLYKWFNTSGKSTCPLCRNIF
ncbi:E3 ubiquitin-protein ligase listerin-like [Hydractinia symbiolongicarpus]|uniref:E3 ubiquitin-protein ligase listerin-like n=1 Tax=Hydractinia symbiolongicarpus TaxID=13093 RepID=UPI0025504A1A|nr:E3 ubiquitin-protein ligase listerin-like [Hydractinia symbiolongicarpus]